MRMKILTANYPYSQEMSRIIHKIYQFKAADSLGTDAIHGPGAIITVSIKRVGVGQGDISAV